MERFKRIPADPPPGIRVQQSGKKILHGVDIRRNIQTRHSDILCRIHDDRDLVIAQDLPETPDEFGRSCAAGKNSDHC